MLGSLEVWKRGSAEAMHVMMVAVVMVVWWRMLCRSVRWSYVAERCLPISWVLSSRVLL